MHHIIPYQHDKMIILTISVTYIFIKTSAEMTVLLCSELCLVDSRGGVFGLWVEWMVYGVRGDVVCVKTSAVKVLCPNRNCIQSSILSYYGGA